MRLHYGDPQIALGIVFAALAFLLAAAFTVIGIQAGTDVSVDRVHRVGYWLRRRWLAFLVVLGVLVCGISLVDLPDPSGAATDWTVVDVTAGQFFWTFSPSHVPAGTHVRFDVTSIDVNHGMGLYSPSGHLIGSVQAMPGYHNRLDLTLAQPGRYAVRCFEYCGINHATMFGSFTVTRA